MKFNTNFKKATKICKKKQKSVKIEQKSVKIEQNLKIYDPPSATDIFKISLIIF